jgi:hypothetical protein
MNITNFSLGLQEIHAIPLGVFGSNREIKFQHVSLHVFKKARALFYCQNVFSISPATSRWFQSKCTELTYNGILTMHCEGKIAAVVDRSCCENCALPHDHEAGFALTNLRNPPVALLRKNVITGTCSQLLICVFAGLRRKPEKEREELTHPTPEACSCRKVRAAGCFNYPI